MDFDPARVKRLFLEASDFADPAARDAYLAHECGANAELLARVRLLLRASDGALMPASAVRDPAASATDRGSGADRSDPDTRMGAVLSGRYKLLEQIGEGGMGTIWMAEQKEPVKRRVALKIIKLGMDTKQVIARFEAERQALALMDHPN